MFIFMGLDAQMIWCLVVSSYPVGGSGTLQVGWLVFNHSVDCRDDISMCSHPLWLNSGDGRDNVEGCR